MKKLIVTIPASQQKTYPIYTGSGLLTQLESLFDLSSYSKAAIITDSNVAKFWLQTLSNSLSIPHSEIIIQAGEKSKNSTVLQTIWSEAIKAKLDRKSLLINLGGGVVGDIGGFAAHTYMRGIDFLHVPTTLTAAVDAMVGGKLMVNFAGLKNYIGAFEQPIGVLIDIDAFKTLPQRAYLEAFAEILKHGLIADKKYFAFVTAKKPLAFSQEEVIKIIEGSNRIKAQVVQGDETETGLRKILNFGHTVGHAVEAVSLQTKHPLMHGEAVTIGMIAETKISNLSGLLSDKETQIIREKITQTGLPVSVSEIKIEEILHKISFDKKNEYGEINWTLLDRIGHAVYDQKVDEDIVKQAVQTVIK